MRPSNPVAVTLARAQSFAPGAVGPVNRISASETATEQTLNMTKPATRLKLLLGGLSGTGWTIRTRQREIRAGISMGERFAQDPFHQPSPLEGAAAACFVLCPPIAGAGWGSGAVAASPIVSAALFARGTGFLNSSNILRIGFWQGSAHAGKDVFRVALGHRSWPTIPGLPPFAWHLTIATVRGIP